MISQLYLTFTRLLILLSLLSIALMFPVSSIYLDEISKFVPSIRFDYNSYYFQLLPKKIDVITFFVPCITITGEEFMQILNAA